MFNRYFITVNETHPQSNSKAIDELGEKLEKIAKDEIESRDRVNISLEEYEQMRKRIETLEGKNSRKDELIIQLGIPAEVIDHILTDSIITYKQDNQMDFTTKYTISFKTPKEI